MRDVQDVTAYRIKKEDIRKFVRLANGLNALIQSIMEYEPEAEYYVGNGLLNLLVGPSHDEHTQPLYENVALYAYVKSMDGGSW
jgi:hypothetical protein